MSDTAWRSIETAPKDGTEVVLLGTLPGRDRLYACISGYHRQEETLGPEDGWIYSAPGYQGAFLPTHWQPLPDVPDEVQVADNKRLALNDIAMRIQEHLRGSGNPYARAWKSGSYVKVSLSASLEGATLTTHQASVYLAWLDAGNMGSYGDYSRAKCTPKPRIPEGE